jgi:Holliday junction DNA helicase RuvB
LKRLELQLLEQVRKHENAMQWLESLVSLWNSKLSRLECEKCGSNATWVDLDRYRCPNGHEGESYTLHFEAWEAGIPPWFANNLVSIGVLRVVYKSNRSTEYSMTRDGYDAIVSILGGARGYEEEGTATRGPIDTSLFDDIIGLDNVKVVIAKALNSDKPVHVLLVGPPASAKSMILERIANYYGVEILLGGTSTRAGLRDYIAERMPELLIIDEIDKVSDVMDLSVLLSWMWHQKITIVMHKRKETIRCPTVCKVIAAANNPEKLPRELLSRFTIVEIPPYTEEEMLKICVNEVKKEGVEEEIAKAIAEAVVKDMKSRDPRDCIKIARMKPETVEEVKLLASTIGLKSKIVRARP